MPEPAPDASAATEQAFTLLAEFAALGVTDVVLAPGSRSQALALAAAELERLGALRVHVRIDERSAGFLALGLGAESGRPALVVTTSGTAVANLHPAVLEAHHAGVPLIALTADRPAVMRGVRANQTTVQPGLFAGAVRFERDEPAPEPGDDPAAAARLARRAYASALGTDDLGNRIASPGPGPVHCNLQYVEPLSAAKRLEQAPLPRSFLPKPATERRALIAPMRGTIVVAGAGAGPEAEEFARSGGWPLVAEVVSGAHFGPNLVVAAGVLLGDADFGGRVRRVIVFGHPTLGREVPAAIARPEVETIVVAPSGVEWYNPGRRVRRFERAVVAAVHEPDAEDRAWLGRWVSASRHVVDFEERQDAARSAAAAPAAAPAPAPGPVAEPASPPEAGTAPRAVEREHPAPTRADVTSPAAAGEHPAAGSGDEPAAPPVVGLRKLPPQPADFHDYRGRREHLAEGLAALRAPITRRSLGVAVWKATWPHDRLVLGASRLVRELDAAAPGKRIEVRANRGLAGIDGTVSTAVGVAIAARAGARAAAGEARTEAAAARAAAGVTRVLLGDLTLLHDVGGLLIGEGEERPRVQLVVGNDHGGTIFDSLEVAASADAAAFDRVQRTPQHVDLEALARAYGWAYTRATTQGELDRALTAPPPGPSILEVPLV